MHYIFCMMKRIIYDYTIDDEEFGTIFVNKKRNSRNAIFRIIDGCLVVVSPYFVGESAIRSAIDSCRGGIRKLFSQVQSQVSKYVIDQDFRIRTEVFDFSVVCDRDNDFYMHYKPLFYDRKNGGNNFVSEGLMADLYRYSIVFSCPKDYDFEGNNAQQWLERVITKAVQNFADPYLTYLTYSVSAECGLSVEQVSVGHAQSRWGSCRAISSSGKINLSRSGAKLDIGDFTAEEYRKHKIVLSAYCALLPLHLAKFIILHELTHTRHPDHSASFHSTLNRLTTAILGLTEAECEKQMKSYSTNIFSFASKKSEPS